MDESFGLGDFHRLLARTHHRHMKKARPALDALGVSRGQPRMLHFLSGHEGCMQREIAEAFDFEPATVTELLSVLERSGLLSRYADPSDRRVQRVRLTEEGRRVHDEVEAVFRSLEEECFAGFSDGEKTVLRQLLARVYGNLGPAEGEGRDA